MIDFKGWLAYVYGFGSKSDGFWLLWLVIIVIFLITHIIGRLTGAINVNPTEYTIRY